jgi:dihydrolipoamide dehydrogenase
MSGTSLFTHVAMYQGRVVADNIFGRVRRVSYHGVPRAVFADPEIAAVGLTADGLAAPALTSQAVEVDLAESLARPWTHGELRDHRGPASLGRLRPGPAQGGGSTGGRVDSSGRSRHPHRDPIDTLLDQVAQCSTLSESYLTALERLIA